MPTYAEVKKLEDVEQVSADLNTLIELLSLGDEYGTFKEWFKAQHEGLDIDIRRLNTGELVLNKRNMRLLMDKLYLMKDSLYRAFEGIGTILAYTESVSSAALTPQERGINSLPSDILSYIFEILKDDESDVMNVSKVTRKFRDVALSTPILWSVLRSTSKLEISKLFLERSKAAELTVHLTHNRHQQISDTFRDMIVGVLHRWREFYIHNTGGGTPVLEIMSSLGSFSLPKLTKLSIHCGSSENITTAPSIPWIIPNLKHIEGNLVAALPFFGSTVTSCEIKHELLQCKFQDFISCLDSLRLCRTLKIEFPMCTVQTYMMNDLQISDLRLSLPNLRCLTLSIKAVIDSLPLLFENAILERVPTRQLQELTLELLPDTSQSIPEVEGIHGSYFFDSLLVFNVIFYRSQEYVLVIDAAKMPKLEHLDITGGWDEPTEYFSSLAADGLLPDLKTITFRDCLLDHNYLANIAETMGNAEIGKRFERLRFFDCYLSDKTKFYLKMRLRGRLEWHNKDEHWSIFS